MRPKLISLIAIVILVAAATLVWALLHTPADNTTSAPVPPSPSAVIPDGEVGDSLPQGFSAASDDIALTAQLLVKTMYAYEPATDNSPQDALARAQQYTTGQLHTAATTRREDYKPSPSWAGWAQSGDTITVAVRVDSVEKTTETTGTVRVWARQSVNSTIPLTPFSVDVHLIQDGDVWLAESYDLANGAPTL